MAFLSQRGMNNVVIFAMLIMIALFNLDTFLPSAKAPAAMPLIPEEAYVLKIEQGMNQLVRNGQGWRQITEGPAPTVSPEQQITAWREAMMHSQADPVDIAGEPIIAVVWLAGQSDGLVFAFYPDELSADGDGALLKYQNQWFRLTDASLATLLPWQQSEL